MPLDFLRSEVPGGGPVAGAVNVAIPAGELLEGGVVLQAEEPLALGPPAALCGLDWRLPARWVLAASLGSLGNSTELAGRWHVARNRS
eukprot:1124283-Alexandrium_andersonii.AAC.1